MKFKNLADLYHYFDQLAFDDVDADILFASSYIRGFVSLSATEYGDDSQPLTKILAENVSEKMTEARTELSPQDREIVRNYWSELLPSFTE